jgi:hypothetical protein
MDRRASVGQQSDVDHVVHIEVTMFDFSHPRQVAAALMVDAFARRSART